MKKLCCRENVRFSLPFSSHDSKFEKKLIAYRLSALQNSGEWLYYHHLIGSVSFKYASSIADIALYQHRLEEGIRLK
jgi:hypothetical protein